MSKTFPKKPLFIDKNVFTTTIIPSNNKDEIISLAKAGEYGKLEQMLINMPVKSIFDNDILQKIIQTNITPIQKEKVIEVLLKKGVPINKLDEVGLPPIYYSVKEQSYIITKLLIEKKANLNITLPVGFDLFQTALVPSIKECPAQLINIKDQIDIGKYESQILEIEREFKKEILELPVTKDIIKELLDFLDNYKKIEFKYIDLTTNTIDTLDHTNPNQTRFIPVFENKIQTKLNSIDSDLIKYKNYNETQLLEYTKFAVDTIKNEFYSTLNINLLNNFPKINDSFPVQKNAGNYDYNDIYNYLFNFDEYIIGNIQDELNMDLDQYIQNINIKYNTFDRNIRQKITEVDNLLYNAAGNAIYPVGRAAGDPELNLLEGAANPICPFPGFKGNEIINGCLIYFKHYIDSYYYLFELFNNPALPAPPPPANLLLSGYSTNVPVPIAGYLPIPNIPVPFAETIPNKLLIIKNLLYNYIFAVKYISTFIKSLPLYSSYPNFIEIPTTIRDNPNKKFKDTFNELLKIVEVNTDYDINEFNKKIIKINNISYICKLYQKYNPANPPNPPNQPHPLFNDHFLPIMPSLDVSIANPPNNLINVNINIDYYSETNDNKVYNGANDAVIAAANAAAAVAAANAAAAAANAAAAAAAAAVAVTAASATAAANAAAARAAADTATDDIATATAATANLVAANAAVANAARATAAANAAAAAAAGDPVLAAAAAAAAAANVAADADAVAANAANAAAVNASAISRAAAMVAIGAATAAVAAVAAANVTLGNANAAAAAAAAAADVTVVDNNAQIIAYRYDMSNLLQSNNIADFPYNVDLIIPPEFNHLKILLSIYHKRVYNDIAPKYNRIRDNFKNKNKVIQDDIIEKLTLIHLNTAITNTFKEIVNLAIFKESQKSTIDVLETTNHPMIKDDKFIKLLKNRLNKKDIKRAANTNNYYLDENYSNSEPIDIIPCLNNNVNLIKLLRKRTHVDLKQYQNLLFKLAIPDLLNKDTGINKDKIKGNDLNIYLEKHKTKFITDITFLTNELKQKLKLANLEFFNISNYPLHIYIEPNSELTEFKFKSYTLNSIYNSLINDQKIANEYLIENIQIKLNNLFIEVIIPKTKEYLQFFVDKTIDSIFNTDYIKQNISPTVNNIIYEHLQIDPKKIKDSPRSLETIIDEFGLLFLNTVASQTPKNIPSLYNEKFKPNLIKFIEHMSQYYLNVYRNHLRYIFNKHRYVRLLQDLE
jgi:hypothetical protein